MNPILRTTLAIAALTAATTTFAAGGAGAPAAPETPAQPATPTDQLQAVIPNDLKSLLLVNPTATFLVALDDKGNLVEYMPVGATHYKLLDDGEKKLLASVVQLRHEGEPAAPSTRLVVITFTDPEQDAFLHGVGAMPFGHSASDAAERVIYARTKDLYTFHGSRPDDLDRPVEVTGTKIMLVTDSAGKPARGRCVVEYWVDWKGTARFARIVESDNDTVSASALLTLKKTQFVAPTRSGGFPTFVKVRQAMEFGAEKPAAK